MADTARSDFSRVFIIENQAGPANQPQYQGLWRAGAVSWDQGDVNRTYKPDPNQYGAFQVDYKTVGEPGSPELPITARYTMDLSLLLKLARNGCDHDLQVHFGICRNPHDFNGGWEKVLILEGARISNYSTGELGALSPDQRAPIDEEVPFSGEDLYEVKRLSVGIKGQDVTTQEVIDVTVCDSKSCGLCGIPSDGCGVVLAVMTPAYGAKMSVLYSKDGGLTWGSSSILTAANNSTPDKILCIGIYTVVLSEYEGGYFYTETADLLAGTAVWTKVTTGFNALQPPRAMWSYSQNYTWFVGIDGNIYFSSDITAGVSAIDEGTTTVQDINAIHGIDNLSLVAVGDNNTVVFTTNGGDTWTAVTGPAVGVNLNTVWMRSASEWIIGTAGGALWYTRDSGTTWTQKAFPGSGSGSVTDVEFVTQSVGYMSHTTTTPSGRILRTIDGGYSWYVLPEGAGSIPSNIRLNAVAICLDANIVFAAGATTTAGIVVGGS